jgi:hypothetical protein
MVAFLHKPRSIAISLSLSSLDVKSNGEVMQYFEIQVVHKYKTVSLERVSMEIFILFLLLYVHQLYSIRNVV